MEGFERGHKDKTRQFHMLFKARLAEWCLVIKDHNGSYGLSKKGISQVQV